MNVLARILRPYIHVLIKIIYKFYFNLRVFHNFEKNLFHVNHGEQYIFCSNHSSHLDALAIICSSGIPVDQFVVIAAKDYFFQSKLQQFLVQLLMEIVPIHRDPTLDQMRENVKMLEEQIHNKKNLILFPEGTRTPDGTIQPFKPGLGYIAKKLALPIVPVFIHGTNTCLPKGKRFPKPGKILVTFTQAMHCEDHWKSLKNQALSDLVYQQIAALSISKHNTVQPPVELSILTTSDPQDDFVK